MDSDLTQSLERLATELGADLFGVAPVARYIEAGAPAHMRPDALLPGATCAVVIAVHHTDAAIELGGEPDPQTQGPYAVQGRMNEKLEHIMFRLGDVLERAGHRVVGLPATNIWRFRGRPEEANPFLPDLSNIHAAWLAGLGEIGWSGLLLSPEFGPRQRFCCLVTDAPLEPSPMYAGEPLCDRCDWCVKHCPTQAFEKEVTGEVVLSAAGSTVRYCEKSKWRCSWAEHFGLDLDLPKPDVITEEVLLEQLARHGVRGGEMGSCLRFCMCAPRRTLDREYTRAPRRKREEPDLERVDEVAAAAYELAFDAGARPWATVSAEWLEGEVDLAAHLPDARSAIVFAMPYPAEARPVAARSAHTWADFLELDLARFLECHGYSALPHSGLDKPKLLAAAGLKAESAAVGCVVTSAPLITQLAPAPEPEPPPPTDALAGELERKLRQAGAHLVGVADAGALQESVPTLREAFDEDALRVHVRDAGPTHGATKPVVEPKPLPVIKGPMDHLPEARSVLVVGVHHPSLNLTLAGKPPASSVGPYAYATYQTVRELELLAWQAARTLHDWGYRAVIVADLDGTASQVLTPRGLQADALSSRFAAAAAGLATIGRHGAPITPEFGVTHRFVSIVTDAPLPPTRADIPDPCEDCPHPCVTACPVGAIAEQETVTVRIGGAEHTLGAFDCLRCDWAKKYGFVAAEGPGLMGQTTDIAPPEGPISVQQIVDAMALKDPVQRHWTCIVERCLQACQRHLATLT
ncbi:MAG: hypothetical protein FJX75_18095 [Armatimonadetes bacterium]|nr:hypothetical protein [Armatimonadota bacterium]